MHYPYAKRLMPRVWKQNEGPRKVPLERCCVLAVDADDLFDRHNESAVDLGHHTLVSTERARQRLVDAVDDARHQATLVRVGIERGVVDAVTIRVAARWRGNWVVAFVVVVLVRAASVIAVDGAVAVVVDTVGALGLVRTGFR